MINLKSICFISTLDSLSIVNYHINLKSIGFISVASEDQEETSHTYQIVAIVGAVCGVVAVFFMCATVYLVIRYRNKRSQNRDLPVAT